MPKFKVGDKIEFEMDGKKVSGTITRDYNSPDHAMYDVRVGAKTMTIADTPMRPANACKNAKFKVGDYVMYKDPSGYFGELPGLVKGTKGDKLTLEVSMGRREEVSDRDAVLMTSKLNVKVGDKIKLWQVARDQTSDEFVIKKINRNDILVEGDSKSGRFTYSFPIEKIRGPRHYLFNSRACRNASFKVGDKVTYWVFDKKLDGSVKAVRGERVDIDDGHGGVVTFKAKDLEVWNACRNDRVKGHFVWFAPWSGRAGLASDEILKKVSGATMEGANIIKVKDEASAQKVYDLFRQAKVPAKDLNIGFNSCRNAKACNSRNPIVAKAMNACGTARNAKFIGRPPARVKQLIEQMEKILEVTDPNDTTDRMMGEVSSLGWSWDDSRRAWVYDDTDIKTDIKWAFKKFLEAVSRNDLERAVDNISDKAMANDFKGMLRIAQKYAR